MAPDFLCIGAQKAGTTWLYECLRRHPDVWMPPVKEIHYFDHPRRPEIRALVGPNPMIRLWMRRRLAEAVRDLRFHPSRTLWYLKVFTLPRDDDWYLSLYRPAKGRVSGDITPAYARLDAPDAQAAQRLLPGAKIIFLLRNPIERMWSQVAMFSSRREAADGTDISESKLLEFLLHPTRLRNSLYDQSLELWESLFGPQQMFVGFYEDLKARPEVFLRQIYGFLSLRDCSDSAVSLFGQKINGRSYPPAPPRILHELANALHPTIQALDRRFRNGHTAAWLDECENYLVKFKK